MKNRGRPFMILFLTGTGSEPNEKICIINVHPDHDGDIYNFDTYLKKKLLKYENYEDYLQKLQSYNIIMMGDFNDNIAMKKTFAVFKDDFFKNPSGRKLYGINKDKTCCSGSLVGKYVMSKAYDHILSTSKKIETNVHNVKKASDHMPIIAMIQFPKSIKMNGGDSLKNESVYYFEKYLKYKKKYLDHKKMSYFYDKIII